MATAFAGSDSYSSYGTKSVYQIKSLISIVDHNRQVAITSNSFTGCTGTKGLIYLDMNHVSASARAVIASNTFTQNAGYLESNVIFLRARGPVQATSLYLDTPSSTTPYCSGYLIQGNTFNSNFGCYSTGGGVITMQCLHYSEASTSPNDVITLSPLSTTTLSSYLSIPFASWSSTTSSIVANGVTYNVPVAYTTFSTNTYSQNTGSGGYGLIDITGFPSV